MIELPLLLIITHFIADWPSQSDWMALNKSKRWDALTIHVTVYTAYFLLVTAWMAPHNWWRFALFFGVITWILHFLTDAITSRITTKLWFIELYLRPEADIYTAGSYQEFIRGHGTSVYGAYTHLAYFKKTRHWFFVTIGFDQLLHYIALTYTWHYLLNHV